MPAPRPDPAPDPHRDPPPRSGTPGGQLAPLGRDRAAREARRAQALRLRLAGLSYDAIAHQLGFRHRAAAYRAVTRALTAMQREAAPAVRALELARLDALLERVWPRAMAGHLPAVDRVLAILDRRARLLGLHTPERVDFTVVTHEARVLAARFGLDVGELLREAERIAQALAAGTELAAGPPAESTPARPGPAPLDAAGSWNAQGRAGTLPPGSRWGQGSGPGGHGAAGEGDDDAGLEEADAAAGLA